MRFKLEDYRGKFCMSCDTEEKGKVFCDYLIKHRKYWDLSNKWKLFKKATVYYFNECKVGALCVAEAKGYKVLSFDDYLWE